MNNSRRWITLVVLVAMSAASAFAAASTEAAQSDDGPLTITMRPFTIRGTTLQPDTPVELYLEQKYNVQLEPWYGVDWYDTEARNVRLASGDVPDLIGGLEESYVNIGVLREIPQDWISQHMPGYMKWAHSYLDDDVWRRTVIDGVNYGVPTALSMASTGQVMGFRADWLRAVGFEPKPVPDRDFFAGPDSLDEIERVLVKFRNEDPDGNGKRDSYGYAVWKNNAEFQRTVLPNVFGAFGVQLMVWDVRNGQGYYSMVDPNYRDALKYINTWWEKEIIHPDTPTMVRADVLRAMANNEFGAWSELDAWQSNYNAGPWGAYREVNPDGDIAFSITPAGPNGQRGTWFRDPNWTPWAVGVNASDAVTVKILQMMEDIFTNRDEYAFNYYGGTRGATWELDENDYAVAIAGAGVQTDTASGTSLGVRMFIGGVSHVVPPIDKVYIAPERHALQSYIEANQVKFPGHGFRPTFDDDERALLSNIETIEQEFAWRALTGDIDIDREWDGYVRRMMNGGLEQLLATVATQGM